MTAAGLTPIVHRAVHDIAYDMIRDAISGGLYAPGQKVSTRKIAKELGLSQMPVREAVQKLVAEGAMQKLSNRTTIISKLTLQDIEELTELRVMVEGRAAFRAATRLKQRQINTLKRLASQMEEVRVTDDRKLGLIQNREFHFLIYEAAGSANMLDLIETLWLRVGPLRRLNYENRNSPLPPNKWHVAAVDAFAAKDAEAAQLAIQNDLLEAAEYIKRAYRQAE